MATFLDIKAVRLKINDPSGFIDLVSVATALDLPATPAYQTAYKVVSTGAYVSHNGNIYVAVDLFVSDTRISDWIDTYGYTRAVSKSYQAIIDGLGARMMISQAQDGAESTTFTSLDKMYSYYKNILADWDSENAVDASNSTGRVFACVKPEVSGGNL